MAGDDGRKAPDPSANSGSRRARMRRFALLASLLVLALGGLAAWHEATRARPPVILTVGTGPFGSDAHTLMSEVADVVERHSSTLRLAVRATRDSSENISQLNRGRIDVGVIRADTPVVADVRIVADLYPDVFHVIVRDDAPVFTVNDLVRARVSIPEFGTDAFRSFWVIGDHYDLPIDRFGWKAEPFEKGAARLLAGQADALFTVRSLRDRQLIRMYEDAQLKGLKLRYLPIRQAEAIAVKRPFLRVSEIPLGAFTGATPVPSIDVPTAGVDRVLVSRTDVPADAIRELTRILFEHRLDLTIRFALAAAIQRPDLARGLSVPMHEGAQSYFDRDEPSFIQENAEPLALLVTVLTLLVSGLFALRSRFTAGQKNRADIYNFQLLDIQKRAVLEDDLTELAGLKLELGNILQTVVEALDTDEVTDDGFQSFSVLLESVRETINDRMDDLRRTA